jgi:hypothetical protein
MNERLDQMSVEYSVLQDRLRFRVTAEKEGAIQFWLTRRIVQALWNGLMVALEKSLAAGAQSLEARQAILSMQHQDALESGAFSSSRKKAGDAEPEIAVVTAVKIGNRPKNAVRVTFITDARREIGLNLPEESVHALCHLLRAATAKTDWALNLHVGDDGALARPPTGNVH